MTIKDIYKIEKDLEELRTIKDELEKFLDHYIFIKSKIKKLNKIEENITYKILRK